MELRLALNFWPSGLHFPSIKVTSRCHHTRLEEVDPTVVMLHIQKEEQRTMLETDTAVSWETFWVSRTTEVVIPAVMVGCRARDGGL